MLLLPMMLLGIGVALFRRSANSVTAGPRPDAPARLLRWATGLLSAQRSMWGQAMLGELGQIEGRGRRWRFTIGCVGAALLLPPWGRTGAGVLTTVAVTLGGLGAYAFVFVHYGLRGAGSVIWAAIVAVLVLSLALAAIALLRRPGLAAAGLLSGLLVAVVWLAMSGFTFLNLIARAWPAWAVPLLFVVVPAVIGVLGTLRDGSAAGGRRTARLAGISAGLGVYLYGTLAVAVVGGGGPPDDNLTRVSSIVVDRLGNNVVFYLALLPLVTSSFGWAAAAATARIRHLPQDVGASLAPATSYGRTTYAPAASYPPAPMLHDTGPATVGAIAAWPKSARVGLVSAAIVAVLLLGFATGLRG